jgi:endonuclease/exonuclease/phosphatase family metal-dependent hydrolase
LSLVSPDDAVIDVLPPEEGGSSTTDRRRLRLLSFNAQVGIHSSRLHHYLTNSWKHFLPFDGRMANLDRVARFISAFDVVGLQELDAGSMRSNYVDLTAYLSERAKFPYAYSRVNRDLGALAKHSLGLLTRLEPERVVMHRLPGPIPGRGAIEARFPLANGESLVLFLVHLALGRRARRSQLSYIAAKLAHEPHAVVMGDFNCHPESRELQTLVARTGLLDPMPCAATYPSWDPRRVFDHILLTPDLSVSDMRVYNVNLSDHLPVGIEIELPGERRVIEAAH